MEDGSNCQLVPLIEFEDEEEISYSDAEFYCEACGEYVDGRCDE